ncbi:MAG: hypothetical protein HDQ98_14895 [Lachnospiraceae bacterium]|nr:hypothetical protein [Lachnospiraceae bacterium]
MKGKYIVGILCGCTLFLMTGCGALTEGKAPSENPVEHVSLEEDVQDESAEESEENSAEMDNMNREAMEDFAEADNMNGESVEDAAEENNSDEEIIEKPAVDHDLYEELIGAAERCVREEDLDVLEVYDFSVIIYMGRHSETLGYRIEDIDGDGTQELIFGDNWGDHTVIYDIYTVFEGELVHVLDGWDRNRYYLCENGMIANEGSSGAAHSNYAYFTFDGVELHLAEAVIYDGDKDRENPWFYSAESEYDAEYAEPISAERATEIINQYVYCDRTFIPFVEDN